MPSIKDRTGFHDTRSGRIIGSIGLVSWASSSSFYAYDNHRSGIAPRTLLSVIAQRLAARMYDMSSSDFWSLMLLCFLCA